MYYIMYYVLYYVIYDKLKTIWNVLEFRGCQTIIMMQFFYDRMLLTYFSKPVKNYVWDNMPLSKNLLFIQFHIVELCTEYRVYFFNTEIL